MVTGEVRDERDDANFQKRAREGKQAGQATLQPNEEAVMIFVQYAAHATGKSS